MNRTLSQACAALLALLASFTVPARAAPGPGAHAPVIPDLTPWLGRNGRPGPTAWAHAAHFSIGYEINPAHDAPAPVATAVAVGYTSRALWLRFRAQDPHPKQIRVRYREHDDISRDAEDFVGVFLSPFNDTQWAYELFCTAGGVESDAFRLQNNEYSSWNAVWQCHAQRTPHGYRVVMRIPFAAIKFPHSPRPQHWGVMFFRNWPRSLRHQLLSRPVDYNSNCTLCSLQVVRTATPIQARSANVQLIPALTLIRTDRPRTPNGPLAAGAPKLKASLDARWVIRPDLEWSATLNPNFSQVAPDVLQLSVNRQFALNYAENRPFFEQGTQVFNTPNFRLSSDSFSPSGALVDTLQIVDPRWASKLVGQVGPNALGALVANDSATNILMPGPESSAVNSFGFATHDALVRYRRDVGASAFGLIATDRSGSGYQSAMYASDGLWQIDPSDTLTALLGASQTTYPSAVARAFGIRPGRIGGGAWLLDFARNRHNYNFDVNAVHLGSNFRADLGYLPQVGYNQLAVTGEYDFYAPDRDWWQNSGFGIVSNWTDALVGPGALDRKIKLYAFVHAQAQTHIILYATREDQTYAGRTFALNQFEVDATAQPTDWLNAEVDVVDGDGVDYVGVRKGALLSVDTTLAVTPGRHLKINLVDDYQRLSVAGAPLYTANLYDVRVAWYFTTRLFIDTIAQAQDVHNHVALYPVGTPIRTRSLATQWLIGYQVNPWTVFYAGSSEGYQESGEAPLLPQQRTYYIKASYYLRP